jgi:hypothetical protein
MTNRKLPPFYNMLHVTTIRVSDTTKSRDTLNQKTARSIMHRINPQQCVAMASPDCVKTIINRTLAKHFYIGTRRVHLFPRADNFCYKSATWAHLKQMKPDLHTGTFSCFTVCNLQNGMDPTEVYSSQCYLLILPKQHFFQNIACTV